MVKDFELSPPEWATLRRLLDDALQRPADDRPAWLAALRGDAAALRPRLEALLAHADDGPAAARLDALPRIETAQFAPRPGEAGAGAQVGPYHLIRQIGEGGMASVWLAERTDMLQGRQVALKLPHGAWRRAGLADRLQREREILATLAHPNIARLYDAGLADDGQPWLALEYVQGERIDAYCERHALDVPARLRLFLQVARAVAHAHAQLVVHRDLKPANILVTDDGEAKLLDFGIAKLLDQGVAVETALTQQAGRALTPDYAAPEQIAGVPLGTAADVYALGVVLYELLAGQRPYTLRRDSRAALEEAIAQAAIEPPSAKAPPDRRRALRGDLDAIVLKALRRLPAARYGTVSAFAEDIERHLAHQPVQAQPAGAGYRLKLLLRRHRMAFGTGTAVVLALAAGSAIALWQAAQARAEQRRAEEARAFVESIFVGADPSGESGRRLTGIELLRQARARLGGLTQLGPAVRIDLLNTLAASLLNLDDLDGAKAVLDDAAREAATHRLDERPLRGSTRLRARLALLQGRPAEARALIDPLVAGLKADRRPDAAELRAALLVRAEAENAALAWDAAELSANELLRLAEQADAEGRPDRIAALLQRSISQDRRNQAQPAFESARQAYELATGLHTSATHPVVAQARAVYAAALWDIDEQDRAVDLMRESRRDAIAVHGADSRIAARQAQKMAIYLASTGHAKEALAAADEALRVLGPTLATDSVAYAQLLDARGAGLLGMHRPQEALAEFDRARAIVVAKLGDAHEQAHVLQVWRARSLMLIGRLEEAAATFESTIERYRLTGTSTIAAPSFLLGLTQRMAGDHARALATQQRTLAAVRPGPTARRWGSRVHIEIGLNRLALGDLAGARSSLTEGLTIVEQKFRTPTPLLAQARLGLGRVELAQGRTTQALPLLEAADAFWREADPAGRHAGEAAYWLARALDAAGRTDAARPARARALQALAASPFPIDKALLASAR